jgi:hypothetical protein
VDERALKLGPLGEGRPEGALNFITPAKRKQAEALVKEGYSVLLEHEV